MSFRDQQKAAYYANVLDGDQLAEEVSFRPAAGGEPRTIWVAIEESEELALAAGLEREVETITVKCGRDETHALGGIADPQLRDTLLRAGETRAYAFAGSIVARAPHSLRMIFERPVLRRIGTQHRQQS